MNSIGASKRAELIKIAIPAILESMVAVIVAAIDTEMISGLGFDTVAAVSLTSQPKMFVLSIFTALGIALSFFVAQANGRSNKEEANKYFHTILWAGIVLSVVVGLLFFVFSKQIMLICTKRNDTVDISVSFIRIVVGLVVFQNTSTILNSALRGIGRTPYTFISSIANAVIDIFVNYLLIEGHWGCPALGVVGDAIATVAGSAAGCAISIVAIIIHSDFISFKGFLTFKYTRDRAINLNICRKASSIVFENMFMRIGFLIMNYLVSSFDPDDVAIYGISLIPMGYSFAFGDGLSAATIALCGKSIGAEDYKSFREYKKQALITGVALSALLCVTYLSGSRWFYARYTDIPEKIGEGVISCYFISAITLFQILRIVAIGALRATGEVKDPQRITTVSVLIINPILAYLFAFILGWEIWGIWTSTLLTQITNMVLSTLCLRHHLKELPLAKEAA